MYSNKEEVAMLLLATVVVGMSILLLVVYVPSMCLPCSAVHFTQKLSTLIYAITMNLYAITDITCSPTPSASTLPSCFQLDMVHGFIEELVVNDDPEYQVRMYVHQ